MARPSLNIDRLLEKSDSEINRHVLKAVEEFDRSGRKASGPVDVVDLFSGCGGLSCGFEAIGRLIPSYRLAAAAEIDSEAVQSYTANLSLDPLCTDLAVEAESDASLSRFAENLQLRAGAPLVLIGGPPCQGFSAHRKKDGKPQDARNDLIQTFARIAAFLRPEMVVLENVPELLAKKHWRKFNGFKQTMQDAGYHVTAHVHNLATFAVPQERFRALVIASKRPVGMPHAVLEPERFRTVRDAIGHLPPVTPGESCRDDPMHYCTRHRTSTIDTIRRVPRDGGRRPHGVGPPCLDRVDGFRDVYGRMYWKRPANTITAYARNPASGRYVHPEQDRGLTIREAALLQGFPRRFVFEGSFDHKFVQIGNAVPPIFAAFLALHLLKELHNPGSTTTGDAGGLDLDKPLSDSFSSGIAGRKRGGKRACRLELRY